MSKKQTPPQPQKYYNVLATDESAGEATILLYGYIGPEWEIDEEANFVKSGITDIDFVQELNRLSEKYNTIHVRINSPGGEIYHGSAIVSAIRRCKAEVITYNDGLAASMAGAIWLAGHKRRMASNALLMLHSASGFCWGTAEDMRNLADVLDGITGGIAEGIAEAIGSTAEAVTSAYFSDYKDHWLKHSDVQAQGWITAEDDYQSAEPPADNTQTMTAAALLRQWRAQHEPKAERQGFLAEMREMLGNIFTPAEAAPAPQQPEAQHFNNVNLQELKDALASGQLTPADVQAALDECATPAPDPIAELTVMRKQMEQLKAELDALGRQPGAPPSNPAAPGADPVTDPNIPLDAKAEYDRMNAELTAAATRGEYPQFRAQG